jgi:pimeloyl-ACP methyl ester carboxylesterase
MTTSSRGITISVPARRAFAALQAVSPAAAARLVERWFFTPPRVTVTAEARRLLRSGRRFGLRAHGRPVVGWAWGSGPTVYLTHGWGSCAGRLGAFVHPLLEAGFRVVAFDAPGHGASGRGLSSMPEFARALQAVVDRHGPARAVVAHSLGAAATALAASWGLAAERLALLAPAADPAAFAQAFATALGVRSDVMTRMRANSERRLRFSWSELDVCAIAARMTAPVLVVHDRSDDVVPFAEGAAIAASWPGARLLPTDGLGHRGMARDATVVAEVVRFVTGSSAPLSESAALEHELFYRETRWR